jgi:hypothetical protein
MIARLFASGSGLQRTPAKWLCRAFGAGLLVHAVLCCSISAAEKIKYTKQAELDAEGNIFVSSDEGKLIKMAGPNHCSSVTVAPDNQTVGCTVTRGLKPEEFSQPHQLEIYLKGGKKKTIEPGAPIREWHFWKDGQQVALTWGLRDGPGTYGLYDIATGKMTNKLAEPADESSLPQWAKIRLQVQNDAVPSSRALKEERTGWITKVLYDIGKIKPGMRRKDLAKIFTTEGGISNRFQRTYVHNECPYIKVNVRFKAAGNDHDALKEDPEDIIESISQPYLAWSVVD